jgi:hypothetical protein
MMAHRAWWFSWIVLLGATLPVPALACVVTSPGSENALRGLPGVAVIIEAGTEIRGAGVSEDRIRDRAVQSLRRAAAPILERSDALSIDRQPLLVVHLETTRVPDHNAFAWHLSLGVCQTVATLDSLPVRVLAQTWSATTSLGITSTSRLRASIEESLDGQLAEFLVAWKRRAQ